MNDQNYISHYGVLGMKWGVRRSRKNNGKRKQRSKPQPHEDHLSAHKRENVESISTDALRKKNKRLNMERRYKQIQSKRFRSSKMVKTLSDKDLEKTLERLNLEEQYKDLRSEMINDGYNRAKTYIDAGLAIYKLIGN